MDEREKPDQREQPDESDTRLVPSEQVEASGYAEPASSAEPPATTLPPPAETTIEMSPEQIEALKRQPAPQRATPLRPANIARAASQGGASQRGGAPIWAYILTTLLIVGLIGGGAYTLLQRGKTSPGPHGCGVNTPCAVADAYIAAFTGSKYAALYALTSQYSRTRFSNPLILHAAAKYAINSADYSSAQDYITLRTQYLVEAGAINNMEATPGAVTTVNATQATVPVRLILSSSRVGEIAEDITIPLRLENKVWKVDWSPGLIYPQLDNAADPNYTDVVRLDTAGFEGQRGTIYDASGDKLAEDGTVYQVQDCPSQVKSQAAVNTVFANSLDLTPAEITSAIGQDPSQCYTERTISPMLFNQVTASLNVPGIQVQQTMGRFYPYGEALAAVTGFVGQVSQQDISNDKSNYYEPGDVIGRAGIEAWGEQYLRPVKGGQLVIRSRNADGSDGPIQAMIAQRQPVNGDDIHTTINLAAQQAAMAKLIQEQPYAGGAVAVNPMTGEVLVLASNPMYDPNDLSLGLTANEQARLNAMDHPYIDRAVQTADPVGSAFKLVTLTAGLENGVTGSQIFTCTGSLTVPGVSHVFVDDAPNGHGSLTAPQALAPSCDVVFWKIGALLNGKDPNILPGVAKQFGYGAPTNMIGLPAGVENPGIVPDPAWMQKNEGSSWSIVDALNLAIGQGYFQATPAQMAVATAAISNGGKRLQPRLVSTVTDATGASVFTSHQTQVGTITLTPDNLQVLQIAMLGPIHDPDGTTKQDFVNYPINVAGKTGTAESGQANPHAWFTCFAPASPITGTPVQPQVAIGALVEYSSYGEMYAVPVAKAILDSLFNLPAGT